MSRWYDGNVVRDGLLGPNRGWIAGTFMADEPRKNPDVEVKFWAFEAGVPTNHPTKTSGIIEITIVLSGIVCGTVDGVETVLTAGDYVVIAPGVENNTIERVLATATGLTIKAPSDPTAKKVVG